MKQKSENGSGSVLKRVPRWIFLTLGVILIIFLLLFIVSFFIDEPLRRSMERRMNKDLKGYTVRLPGLSFEPIGLSVTLKGLAISQNAYPTPPVAEFERLRASIHWREILSGKMVAEFVLDRPRININLNQLRAEKKSATPIKERGWQQAVEEIYPLKINMLRIREGDLVYSDEDPNRPLHLGQINLQAENIRNIEYPDNVYPSAFHLDAVIFGTGRGTVDGKANFLAEPFPGVKAEYRLEKVPLDYFKPVLARSNIAIRNGSASSSGSMEYAPNIHKFQIKELEIAGVHLDYIHSPETAKAEKKRTRKVKEAAGEVSNKPGTIFRIDELRLKDSNVGWVNRTATPDYRVFLANTDFRLTNLSNHFSEGPADAILKGLFMGSGKTSATARFRPEKEGPDFDLNLKINDTQLKGMNDLLKAYGNFDVSEGYFSLFTELHIKNNRINGYVKPLFRDMKVYDRRKDKEKSLFRKMYEMLVGGVANLLENRPREEVATKADISGPLQKPETSTLQIILELIRNAFIKAILPGFEQEVTRVPKK